MKQDGAFDNMFADCYGSLRDHFCEIHYSLTMGNDHRSAGCSLAWEFLGDRADGLEF